MEEEFAVKKFIAIVLTLICIFGVVGCKWSIAGTGLKKDSLQWLSLDKHDDSCFWF